MAGKLNITGGYYIIVFVVVFGFGFVFAHTGGIHNPGHAPDRIDWLDLDLTAGDVVCTSVNSPFYLYDAIGNLIGDNPNHEPGCGIVPAPLLAPDEGEVNAPSEGGTVSSSSVALNHLVKFDGGGSNMVEARAMEVGGKVGIGNSNPSGKLDVVNGRVLVGAGTPQYANEVGDLYVQNDLEVDGYLCIKGEGCVRDSLADSLLYEAFSYVGRYVAGKGYGCMKSGVAGSEKCEIGSVEDYKYCAIGTQVSDKGMCRIYTENDKWYVSAYLYAGSKEATQCTPVCLKRG
jgi:hypothetical protein